MIQLAQLPVKMFDSAHPASIQPKDGLRCIG
jgi:hypothetical protein